MTLVFAPLLPWAFVIAAAALGALAAGLALWRGLAGWPLRLLAAGALGAALAGPALRDEERTPLPDIVLLAEDASASNRIAERVAQTVNASAEMAARIAARPNTELVRLTVPDGEGDAGTRLMAALSEALSEVPAGRVAGAVAITDGHVHDADAPPNLPAPLHVLLTGEDGDWDRRLSVVGAPAYAILGEQIVLTLRVEDEGDAPPAVAAEIAVSVGADAPFTLELPVGRDIEVPITLTQGGLNVLRFETPVREGELTARNNAAIVQMNGVRDRLRVLLVSGEPHPGSRTWRNLLKSDPQLDLVHFTILRPPGKQDGVPVDELSLIAFPTRELFMEKIEDFDLIVFDRYQLRGILPGIYLENVRRYAENGGAVLVAAGPDFAAAESIARSPLGPALPGRPTGVVIEGAYRPTLSDVGDRHPVTAALGDDEAWGRWHRVVETTPGEGETVMTDAEGHPLLMLRRYGEGRVALLTSDHAWLWARGHDGGGPQLELLRRLAHWLMKEPELEEEALTATAAGQEMTIARRTLAEETPPVTVTDPEGNETIVDLAPAGPGLFTGRYTGPEMGLYRLSDGLRETVIGLGPAAPREFVRTVATGDVVAPAVEATGGGIVRISEGLPRLRDVRAGRPAAGRGWIGLLPREAAVTTDLRIVPLLPAWGWLVLAAALIVGAWLVEGRRRAA